MYDFWVFSKKHDGFFFGWVLWWALVVSLAVVGLVWVLVGASRWRRC